jgi:hypothetical protein
MDDFHNLTIYFNRSSNDTTSIIRKMLQNRGANRQVNRNGDHIRKNTNSTLRSNAHNTLNLRFKNSRVFSPVEQRKPIIKDIEQVNKGEFILILKLYSS